MSRTKGLLNNRRMAGDECQAALRPRCDETSQGLLDIEKRGYKRSQVKKKAPID